MRNLTLIPFFLFLLLAGCAGPTALPPTATPAPEPTATHRPTVIPSPFPTATALAAPGMHPYETRVTVSQPGSTLQQVTLRYLLFFPAEYGKDPTRRWPLILFLHGSGEAGSDLNLLKKNGLPARLLQEPEVPFVVVAPQIPAATYQRNVDQPPDPNLYIQTWGWGNWIAPLDRLLDQIESSYAIDPQRVYLTGLSLGGFGAWEYALRYPKRFAAVAPIAGGYRFGLSEAPENICALKDTPIWAFHGDQDTAVAYQNSEVLVKGLEACGGNVKFTLYPGAGHNDSFHQAYADPHLYEWMLENTLRNCLRIR
jgi:predicted peptidase